MQKRFLKTVLIGICLGLSLLLSSSAAFAMGGMPSQPPGAPPRGLAIHGDVAGTKVTGTITIEFSPLYCSTSEICNISGADYGYATAKMRLRKAGGNLENAIMTDSGKTQIQVFTAALGPLPLDKPGEVQAKAIEVFTPQILQAFFPGNPGLALYTKDVSEYSLAFTYDPGAAFGTYFPDPVDYVGKVVKVSVFTDVVLTVK